MNNNVKKIIQNYNISCFKVLITEFHKVLCRIAVSETFQPQCHIGLITQEHKNIQRL